MSKWEKYLALPLRERILFLQFIIYLPVLDAALRVLGYQKLRRLLARFPGDGKGAQTLAEALGESRQLAWLVSAAARHGFYPVTCLRQSLLTWWLLRLRGIHSDLRIGVQELDGKLRAHAWIKVHTEIISDGMDIETRFSVFKNHSL